MTYNLSVPRHSSRHQAVVAVLVVVCFVGCAHHNAVRPDATVSVTQQPLGTRARAFAQYVIAMHRQIHRVFTIGFLADADARRDPAFADQALWTQLSIAVNADGRIDRVDVLRKSGLQAFDAATVESVLAAAPFPPPPDSIKSADGRVHVDWQFHRDERSCGVFGVDPHIYGTVTDEGDRALAEAVQHARSDVAHDHDTAARIAAEGWFAAYVRGDAAWLAGWSATPFLGDGEVIARDVGTLKKFYTELVAAKPIADNAFAELKLLTPAAMRSAAGQLPPGGDPDMLFATGLVSRKSITLLLKKSNQGWRVCGMDRGTPQPSP
jgi:TonB family protein